MTDSQITDSSKSFCEIAGCSSPAVKEMWSVDEDRHLRVCWKHTDDDSGTLETS